MKPNRCEFMRSLRSLRTVLSLLVTLVFLPDARARAADRISEQPSADPREISGVWWTKTYTPRLLPVHGGEVPLTEAGRQFYEQAKEAFTNRSFRNEFAEAGVVRSWRDYVTALRGSGVTGLHTNVPTAGDGPDLSVTPVSIMLGTLRKCLPPGVPRIMAAPYPFRIVQTRGQVTFQYEMNRVYRIVRMDTGHANPDIWDPSYTGEAVGHWEKDTLVIDTVNFNDQTFLDRSGLPHSEQLHVVERLRKIHGGRQLEALINIDDPVMYTTPWTTRLVYEWRPDIRVQGDWVCDEKHRDLSQVKGIPK